MPAWLVRMFVTHRSLVGVLAVVIGAFCGLASVGFHYLIQLWSRVMTGYTDYTEHIGQPHGWLHVGVWFLIFVPAISGLIYGPMIARWAPSARGHGIPEVMLAVRRKGGKIPGRVAIVKILASALTIGGGGSAGREGPIVQVGAALGSWLSGVIGLPKNTVILLAACGAAGGIAATFNAPLAGAVFALELILTTFNAYTFGMAVLSSVSASVVAHIFLGGEAIITIPTDLTLASDKDLVFVAIIGVIGCAVGLTFTKLLYFVEDVIDFFYNWPEWLRPAVGGLIVGALLLIWPQQYGSGYPIQLNVLEHSYTIGFIVFLLVGRMIATSITIGMGGSGGVFAPTLFMGACAGAAFGQAIEGLTATSSATYGVICMGAAFAGASRAPITAVLIIVEMTGQYNLILPIMLAVVLATALSRFLTRKTIYTTKLIRRGDSLDDPVEHTLIGNTTAAQIMGDPPTIIAATTSLREAATVLRTTNLASVPVVDPDRRFVGCISQLMIAQARSEGVPGDQRVDQLPMARDAIAFDAQTESVLHTLINAQASGLPVVRDEHVVGWISQRDMVSRVYRQYRRALDAKNSQTSWGSRMNAKLARRRQAFLESRSARAEQTGSEQAAPE